MLKHGFGRVLTFILWLLLALPVLVFADTIQGSVVSSGPMGLELAVYDSQGRIYPNTLHLKVDNKTRPAGNSTAAMLKPNDPVQVEIKQDNSGQWRAESVSRLQGTSPAPFTATQPSNPIMNALQSPQGQKMIREGVSGAVVGGVASAASGGKLGKGALIGAGAGVAAGWLTDYLSRPQSASASLSSDQDTRRSN